MTCHPNTETWLAAEGDGGNAPFLDSSWTVWPSCGQGPRDGVYLSTLLGQSHPAGLLLVVTPGFLLHCFLHCQLHLGCSDLWTSALHLAGGTPSLPPKGPQVLPLLRGHFRWALPESLSYRLQKDSGTKQAQKLVTAQTSGHLPPCTSHSSREYVLLHQTSLRAMVWAQATARSSGGTIAPAVSSSHADPSSSPQPLSW